MNKVLEGLAPFLLFALLDLAHVLLLKIFVLRWLLLPLNFLEVKLLNLCGLILLSFSFKCRLKLLMQLFKIWGFLGFYGTLRSLVLFVRLNIFTRKFFLEVFLHSGREFGFVETLLGHSGNFLIAVYLLLLFLFQQVNWTEPGYGIGLELKLLALLFRLFRCLAIIETEWLLVGKI